MRAMVLAIALTMSGCAAAPAAPAERSLPARVSVERSSVQCEPVQPPRRELGPNLCLPDGLPKAAPEEELSNGATCVDRPTLARRVAHKLAKSYQRVANGRVDVSFDCDPLTGVVTEIVIERGYGHGGSLQIWRFTRSGDDDAPFDVSAIAHDTFYTVGPDDDRRALPLLAKGAIPAKDVQTALESTRALLTASVREMEPPPKPNSLGLHSMFFSSGNFHQHFRLRDGFRHELARGYSGYPNSDGQRRYLPIQHAMEHLAPLLDRFEFVRGAPSPELRTWLSAYVVSAWPRLQNSDAWWVRERLQQRRATPRSSQSSSPSSRVACGRSTRVPRSSEEIGRSVT